MLYCQLISHEMSDSEREDVPLHSNMKEKDYIIDPRYSKMSSNAHQLFNSYPSNHSQRRKSLSCTRIKYTIWRHSRFPLLIMLVGLVVFNFIWRRETDSSGHGRRFHRGRFSNMWRSLPSAGRSESSTSNSRKSGSRDEGRDTEDHLVKDRDHIDVPGYVYEHDKLKDSRDERRRYDADRYDEEKYQKVDPNAEEKDEKYYQYPEERDEDKYGKYREEKEEKGERHTKETEEKHDQYRNIEPIEEREEKRGRYTEEKENRDRQHAEEKEREYNRERGIDRKEEGSRYHEQEEKRHRDTAERMDEKKHSQRYTEADEEEEDNQHTAERKEEGQRYAEEKEVKDYPDTAVRGKENQRVGEEKEEKSGSRYAAETLEEKGDQKAEEKQEKMVQKQEHDRYEPQVRDSDRAPEPKAEEQQHRQSADDQVAQRDKSEQLKSTMDQTRKEPQQDQSGQAQTQDRTNKDEQRKEDLGDEPPDLDDEAGHKAEGAGGKAQEPPGRRLDKDEETDEEKVPEDEGEDESEGPMSQPVAQGGDIHGHAESKPTEVGGQPERQAKELGQSQLQAQLQERNDLPPAPATDMKTVGEAAADGKLQRLANYVSESVSPSKGLPLDKLEAVQSRQEPKSLVTGEANKEVVNPQVPAPPPTNQEANLATGTQVNVAPRESEEPPKSESQTNQIPGAQSSVGDGSKTQPSGQTLGAQGGDLVSPDISQSSDAQEKADTGVVPPDAPKENSAVQQPPYQQSNQAPQSAPLMPQSPEQYVEQLNAAEKVQNQPLRNQEAEQTVESKPQGGELVQQDQSKSQVPLPADKPSPVDNAAQPSSPEQAQTGIEEAMHEDLPIPSENTAPVIAPVSNTDTSKLDVEKDHLTGSQPAAGKLSDVEKPVAGVPLEEIPESRNQILNADTSLGSNIKVHEVQPNGDREKGVSGSQTDNQLPPPVASKINDAPEQVPQQAMAAADKQAGSEVAAGEDHNSPKSNEAPPPVNAGNQPILKNEPLQQPSSAAGPTGQRSDTSADGQQSSNQANTYPAKADSNINYGSASANKQSRNPEPLQPEPYPDAARGQRSEVPASPPLTSNKDDTESKPVVESEAHIVNPKNAVAAPAQDVSLQSEPIEPAPSNTDGAKGQSLSSFGNDQHNSNPVKIEPSQTQESSASVENRVSEGTAPAHQQPQPVPNADASNGQSIQASVNEQQSVNQATNEVVKPHETSSHVENPVQEGASSDQQSVAHEPNGNKPYDNTSGAVQEMPNQPAGITAQTVNGQPAKVL